jgi:RNA polymerase sigma factor (sigma-70 family)
MATTLGTALRQLRRSLLRQGEAGRTDGELLEGFIARREEAAFQDLLQRHGPMVLGVCRRVLRNEADAEDAFQATFLVLVRKAASIRPRGMVGNWLYGVAHTTALKARAMNTRRSAKEQEAARRTPKANADNWEQLCAVLDQELKALPDKYRAAIVLCDLEGKTVKEAARQLGCPPGTVGTRRLRGRGLLARRLARHGLTLSGGTVAALLAQHAAAGVPPLLLSATLRAATLLAAGAATATNVIPAKVTALTEGALKTMLLSKLKLAAALALVLFACVGGALAFLPGAAGPNEAAAQAEAAAGRGGAGEAPAQPAPGFPDLTKIDRTLVKEPRYRNQPYYALLAIGPEAKQRVWLVVDGDVVYVDRNGNGDLTEANERVSRTKKIEVAPGMYKWMDSFDLGEVQGLPLRLDFWVRDKDFFPQTDFDEEAVRDHEENGRENATLFRVNPDGSNVPAQVPLAFCRQPKDAQVCHLAGPLTFALRSYYDLERQSDKNSLSVMIGTPGLRPRNSTDPVFAPLATTEVPADLHPVADLEFPHKDPTRPPIKLRVVLDQRC